MKETLEDEGNALVDWFDSKQMKANPEKQIPPALALEAHTHDLQPNFKIKGTEIQCTDEVKLLRVTTDHLLNFFSHISELCKKSWPTDKRITKNC